MLRNCSLDEISDGRLYEANDMVKAYCNDCKGCHACCEGMGESIILDPLDIYRLTKETGKSFEALLADTIELNVVDGLILPNIKMVDGRPVWGKQCIHCMACLHACPQEVIQYGKTTRKKGRYRLTDYL